MVIEPSTSNMTLVYLFLTVFVLQNIGKCYLSTDINKTLHRMQKEIRALEQKMGLLYKYCQLQRDNIVDHAFVGMTTDYRKNITVIVGI